MILWFSLFLISSPVNVEVDILNGDVMAARDVGQSKAFEKAIEQTFSEATPVDLRAQRLKSPARYIKSYRLVDEKRNGEKLQLTYDIELQDLNIGTTVNAAPLPDASSPSVPKELRFEIVFVQRFPAAEVVDQLASQMKLKVNSFRLTRSAVILKIMSDRPVTQIQQEMQALLGARGQVNYVSEEIGVPMPLAPAVPLSPTEPMDPSIVAPTTTVPAAPPATPLAAPSMAPQVATPVAPSTPPAVPGPATLSPQATPIVEAPQTTPDIQHVPTPQAPPEPPAPKKPEWKPVRPKPWTPPIFEQQKRP